LEEGKKSGSAEDRKEGTMKILVPVDGSKSSGEGARLARDLAQAKGAQVTLLAVVPVFPDTDLEISARARESLDSKLSARAEEALERARGVFTGLSVGEVIISSNDVADEIIKMADQEKMDLIVIGSRGLKATGRFSVGGTALKVVSNAPCSVLVAKASD
jgi:nucleotide-binding universal stress UspA family protein